MASPQDSARGAAEAAALERTRAHREALFGSGAGPSTPGQGGGPRATPRKQRSMALSPEAVKTRMLDQVQQAGFAAEHAGWRPPHVGVQLEHAEA